MKALIAYIPVWHAGYQQLFESVIDKVEKILLIDPPWAQTLSPDLDYLRKEIRALSAPSAQQLLIGLYPDLAVEVLNSTTTSGDSIKQIDSIVAPDEDVSRIVVEKFFPTIPVEYSPIFLRWDRAKATEEKPIVPNTSVTANELTNQMFTEAYLAAEKSSDWWRHVGAVLAKDDDVLFSAANRHKPADMTPYIVGDVRQLFHQSEYMNYSTAEHAETAVLAEAARRGVATIDASLYVTTFPCPYCARLIAHSGITKLYFAEGYATLDGEELLKQAGIEIIQVKDLEVEKKSRSILKPYPKK
ncbi:hypothetical protein KBC89_02805 [Candidatus Woesebacteria bacterium]|nr:hypothetical protein [Candidatus Woesebacteria bacterium]